MNQASLISSFPEIAYEFQERESLFMTGFLNWEDVYLVVLSQPLYITVGKSLMGNEAI